MLGSGNFRDEKTLLGCGQAQVRTPQAVEKVPAFIVALYALLQMAAHNTYRKQTKRVLPRPRWYPNTKTKRLTSREIINLLRTEMWAKALGGNFSGFVKQQQRLKSHRNTANPLPAALFYVRK